MNPTIKHLIDTKAEMHFHAGASEDSIRHYENEANVKIPSAFREWLLFSDGGEIFVPGTVLYGVDGNAKPSLFSGNSGQERGTFALGDSLLVIGRFNFGDFLCVDTNSGEVVQWNHEADEEFLRWSNFFAFIEEEIASFTSEG
ncbi:hypothetical protein Hs30E_10470 [Lactococcus hodotermopsidis]|uniref:Knr4/Smi1-like domain-containing protein n=1 Tax=Pseudolactococcus hodotermopsidis TaxID=2709157 RepID=A0A6A0BCC1_9LACT|nr:SMI1/KNR4 family protein [Lactococcus hodotermopsidis]GFH42496.1 hypothetical protein Hs30E_10470 [Lactococcus hodotermopsidis]